MPLTYRDLLADLADASRVERLLTLNEVAEVTGETMKIIKRWAYTDKVLPLVRYGPHRRPRVRALVVLQMFAPHLLPSEPPPSPRPVRYAGNRMRPCGPR